MSDKAKRILELVQHNAYTGEAVHCWCEGGDATEDDWEVPEHLAAEAQRIVDKRLQEIEEAAEKRKAGTSLYPSFDL